MNFKDYFGKALLDKLTEEVFGVLVEAFFKMKHHILFLANKKYRVWQLKIT